MLSTSCLFVFLGFYGVYNTSKRAQLNAPVFIEDWLRRNPMSSRIISIAFWILAYGLSVSVLGVSSGILTTTIVLMLMGSLIVILTPLKILSISAILLTYVFALCIELLILYIHAS